MAKPLHLEIVLHVSISFLCLHLYISRGHDIRYVKPPSVNVVGKVLILSDWASPISLASNTDWTVYIGNSTMATKPYLIKVPLRFFVHILSIMWSTVRKRCVPFVKKACARTIVTGAKIPSVLPHPHHTPNMSRYWIGCALSIPPRIKFSRWYIICTFILWSPKICHGVGSYGWMIEPWSWLCRICRYILPASRLIKCPRKVKLKLSFRASTGFNFLASESLANIFPPPEGHQPQLEPRCMARVANKSAS